MEVAVAVGTGVEAGAQPANKNIRKTKARKTDLIDFFITSHPYDPVLVDATMNRLCGRGGIPHPLSRHFRQNAPLVSDEGKRGRWKRRVGKLT
jgi:hypothetical protein